MNFVIGFGCPRSGTTFLAHVLSGLKGSWSTKLTENTAMHPCQSTRGLLDLADLAGSKPVALVRIVRNPLEVADSFLAARMGGGMGLARNTDRDIALWIRGESESVAMQRPLLLERPNVHWLEVRYEDLAAKPGRRAFIEDMRSYGADAVFRDRLDEFGKNPIRPGRLSAGVERAATDDEAAYFRRTLRCVMDREGYV
jgi:hypothetical protein